MYVCMYVYVTMYACLSFSFYFTLSLSRFICSPAELARGSRGFLGGKTGASRIRIKVSGHVDKEFETCLQQLRNRYACECFDLFVVVSLYTPCVFVSLFLSAAVLLLAIL